MELLAIKLAVLKAHTIVRSEIPNVSFRERNFLLHNFATATETMGPPFPEAFWL